MITRFVFSWGARQVTGILFAAGLVCAQGIDSTLVGRVTDPSGAAIPNSEVVAKSMATGIEHHAASDRAGQYRMEHLPVGVYEVTAGAANFAAQTTANVDLQLNRTAAVSFTLAVATKTTSVNVTDAAAPLDTASSQVQSNFDSRSLINVPTAATGSGFLNLSLLAAGVASSGGLGQGTGPSIAGQRPTGNRFFIEGADNNSYFTTGPLWIVSNEALSEFTVLQNHFGSEFGGATGGIFNAIVKSGGNEVHGSLYEYLQNRELNALNAQYARQGATSPPRYDNNRLGGSIGGPIVRNKLFYFANFEYNPVGNAFAPANVAVSPTAAGFQTLAGLPGISSTNLKVLQQYSPAVTTASGTINVLNTQIPVGALSILAPSYSNTYSVASSVDWNVGDRDQVRARYLYSRFSGLDTTSVMLPQFFTTIPSNTHLVSLSEYHSLSPTTQNEFRAAYSRNDNRRTAANPLFPGLDTFPTIYFDDTGLQLGPNPAVPNGQTQGQLQFADSVTHTIQRHTIKVGYDFSDIILTTSFVSNPRGTYDYQTLGQFLLDRTPDTSGTRFLSTSGPVVNGIPAGFLQNAAFLQDDFRVLPNLTLNLGVRYEYVTVPILSRAQQFSAIANVPGVLTFGEPQPGKNDWSPRLGFAYSPGKGGLWVVRGGFSRAFDMPYANLAANTAPAFYGGSVGVNVTSNAPNFLANGGLSGMAGSLLTPAAARAATSGYTPDQMRPYALNYTLSVQRLLGRDYTLEVRYLGSRGVHLLVQQQLNRSSDVTATNNIPTFLTKPSAAQLAALTLTTGALKAVPSNTLAAYGFTNSASITALEPQGNSDYNGLAVQMTKRYSKNFSYLAAYTWSHLMDDSTADVSSTLLTPRRPEDFNNLGTEWASSILDRRHRLTLTPILDVTAFSNRGWALRNLVGNWNLAMTYTFESPEYATIQSGVDSNLNNDTSSDRTIINTNGVPGTGSGVTGYNSSGSAVSASSSAIVAYVANNPNAQYIVAGLGAFANGGRNTFPFDYINNVDFSLRKVFRVTESKRFEVGAQFYNLFNHPQFVPGLTDDVALSKNTNRNFLIPSNAAFGQYQNAFSSASRYIQLTARFAF